MKRLEHCLPPKEKKGRYIPLVTKKDFCCLCLLLIEYFVSGLPNFTEVRGHGYCDNKFFGPVVILVTIFQRETRLQRRSLLSDS